jgi:hemerythrin
MRTWSDDYNMGVESLDRQHRMLFTRANAFEAALHEGRGASVYDVLLRTLGQYIQYHVGVEDRYMQRYHCPVAQQNRDAHATFAAGFAAFQQRYAEHGFDDGEACTLMTLIDEWLTDYIGSIDVHLRPYVQSAPGGETP